MMNVYQKINEVKKEVKMFNRDAETSGKGAYSFVSGKQILETIKAKMEEIGLLFLPVKTEHRGWTTFEYKNSYGDSKVDFIVDGKLVYAWVNADEPNDRHIIEFEYYGQQNDISKAFGSALTYSERYLLLKSLGVPTSEDDPDNNNEDKFKNGKRTGGGSSTPPAGKNPPVGKKPPEGGKGQQKSKFAQINDLIKDSSITIDTITDWIVQASGKNIRINDLNDEQFAWLVKQIKAELGR